MSGDAELIEDISRHLRRSIGKIGVVFHEVVSDDLHIDVHHVPSSWRRRFELLVTSGMSELPMSVPDDGECPYAELAILLPRGWPLTEDAFRNEDHYWPVRLIKYLARLPHENDTWLGYGHTVSAPEPEPFSSSVSLCGALIVPSMTLPQRFFSLERADRTVQFWCVVPLHASEIELACESGSDALLDLFGQHGVSDIVAPTRAPVV